MSTAVLNAANPAQPIMVDVGPLLIARPPPVMHPAMVPFQRSFLARKDSIPHSTPEKISPMYPKFFAEDHVRRPISLNWIFTCCLNGKSAICCAGLCPGPIPGATSYAIEAMNKPKKPPRTNPDTPDITAFPGHDEMNSIICLAPCSACSSWVISWRDRFGGGNVDLRLCSWNDNFEFTVLGVLSDLGFTQVVSQVVTFGTPGDIVDVTECIDVQNVDVSWTQQQVLNKTSEHVTRVQEDERSNEVESICARGCNDQITEFCLCKYQFHAEIVGMVLDDCLDTLYCHEHGSKDHVNHEYCEKCHNN
ncbi:hypothetical protein OGAPHI_000532 [Ogataea philodendri]|uniref:Uncharacterized protein n=1 Tax=Ogataea philodendri TaxID=1378263 RepID=A0A9P8PHF2_9ASCO|nr:uncharacterized protein OGAPHI_000532 [Ogataea philodendri]KAH3671309.1 hypothetical protein OGAPHI_000532 [Ogataea philodendri]